MMRGPDWTWWLRLRFAILNWWEDRTLSWRLPGSRLNELQHASMRKLVRRCKQAHHADVRIRINGEYEWYQVDWIKHLEPPQREGGG